MKTVRMWIVVAVAGLAIGATFLTLSGSVQAGGRAAETMSDKDGSACATVEGRVEARGMSRGELKRAERLAAELGISVEELLEQRSTFDVSLRELALAHDIEANATTDISLEQIFEMKAEGASWSEIAARAGLTLSGKSRVRASSDDCDREGGTTVQGMSRGELKRAARLAAELGITVEELLEQRSTFDVSLKELALAHEIEANATTDISLEQIFEMKAEGASWSEIAAQAGLTLRGNGKVNGNGKAHVVASSRTKTAVGARAQSNFEPNDVEAGAAGTARSQTRFRVNGRTVVTTNGTRTRLMTSGNAGANAGVKNGVAARPMGPTVTTRANVLANSRFRGNGSTALTTRASILANSRFQGNGSTRTVGGVKINRNSGLGRRIAAGAVTRVNGTSSATSGLRINANSGLGGRMAASGGLGASATSALGTSANLGAGAALRGTSALGIGGASGTLGASASLGLGTRLGINR